MVWAGVMILNPHIILIGILTLASTICMVMAIVNYVNNYRLHGPTWRSKHISVCAMLSLFSLGLIVWIWESAIQPLEMEYQQECLLSDVVYPDGTKVQMFVLNGVYYNVTAMTGKFFNSEEWVVKKVIWKSAYKGISYWGMNQDRKDDESFVFVKNDKTLSSFYNGVRMQMDVFQDGTTKKKK